jgi:hypothetical protein
MPLSFTSIKGCCWKRDAYICCQLTGKSLFHKTVLSLYLSVWFFWVNLSSCRFLNQLTIAWSCISSHVPWKRDHCSSASLMAMMTSATADWSSYHPFQKSCFTQHIYGVTTVFCLSLHFDLKKKKKTSGLLDSVAECWQHHLLVGKGRGL